MKRSIVMAILFCLLTACAAPERDGSDMSGKPDSVTAAPVREAPDTAPESGGVAAEPEGWDRIGEASTVITDENYPKVDGSTSTLGIVRAIYTNLVGPDKTLIPICRNADSGSQSQMDNLILDGREMDSRIRDNYVELTMEGMLEQVAFYHNGGLSGTPTDSYALGYTLYTYLEEMDGVTGIGEYLKILSFEGVEPTLETIGDGSYPLTDAYYAVVRGDLPKDHAAWSILAWLKSDAGVRAIESMGYVSSIK